MALIWVAAAGGALAAGRKASEATETVLRRPNPEKTNFVENFALEDLGRFTKERRFVMVLFTGKGARGDRAALLFFRLAGVFESREVFFVEIDPETTPPEELRAHHATSFPDLRLYVYGFPRRYPLRLGQKTMEAWIKQIIEADVAKIATRQEVHPVDTHYVVAVRNDLYQANPAHFTVLAKLISPTTLYTGLPDTELDALAGRDSDPQSDAHGPPLPGIFAHREHDRDVVPIPEDLSLPDKARLIAENEFPPQMDCTDSSLRLVVEHKIPVLAYFDSRPDSPHWPLVRSLAAEYREFLLLIFVDLRSQDKCAQFFREFLSVDQPESLRILDMHGKIKRYEFIGAFTEPVLRAFLENFVSGNLRPYALNEVLAKDAAYRGIPLANSRMFRRVTGRLQSFALFYVYAHDNPRFEEHVGELRVVQSVFRKSRKFSVHLVDHLRNDLDGYYHARTPFLVFVVPTGKVHYFEAPELRAAGVIKWVLGLVPFLEIAEPAAELFDEL